MRVEEYVENAVSIDDALLQALSFSQLTDGMNTPLEERKGAHVRAVTFTAIQNDKEGMVASVLSTHFPSSAAPTEKSGSSASDDDDETTTIITVGVVVLVGGAIAYDMLLDTGVTAESQAYKGVPAVVHTNGKGPEAVHSVELVPKQDRFETL